MRRLWFALVHGRDTSEAKNTTSSVDIGEDLRWRITQDSDGDNRLRLEERPTNGSSRWKTVESKYWDASVDLARVVPRAQRKLLAKHRRKQAREQKNRETKEFIEANNQQWARENI